MSHNAKSKAKGVSATSFFDLKAELVKQETEFSKARAAGDTTVEVKRTEKKKTVWARQNKGVKDRAKRDAELEAVSRPTLDSARAILERKAKIYDKLRKGKSGGLSEAQYDALLVDFDAAPGPSGYFEEDSEDEDESLMVPKAPDGYEDDPIVEYEDEFGRVRTARRSEIPREFLHKEEEKEDSDEDFIIHDPSNHFPIFQPSEERQAEIAQEFAESNNPLNLHYDATKEVRNKGAGFYQFSIDEETRRAQMEELRKAREETEQARKEAGAEDVKPGEVEGMRGGGSTLSVASRAMEKRKRDLEARRQLLEAKRRKLQSGQPVATETTKSDVPVGPSVDVTAPTAPPSAPLDPFAALEVQSTTTRSKSEQQKPKNKVPKLSEADTFLQELEQDFMGSKGKK